MNDMTDQLTLGVIFGGASVEHEISIRSAQTVIAAADPNHWRILPIGVTRDGHWLDHKYTEYALEEIRQGETHSLPPLPLNTLRPLDLPIRDALSQCHVIFPMIHGASGEDGALQGLLESAQIPYIGAGVGASAIAMDKARCKLILEAAGIPVAPSITISCDRFHSDPAAVIRDAADIGYPYFVKPSRGGSSIGTSKVETREDAYDAFRAAFACDFEILVEEAMPAPREIECALLGRPDGAEPIVSPLGEIRTQRDFYDYVAKYEDPDTELIAPADLDAKTTQQIQEIALAAWRAVGCEGMVRADFLLGADGAIWLGELNTIPGFTSVSMYPRLMELAGFPLPQLIDQLAELGLQRTRRQPDKIGGPQR